MVLAAPLCRAFGINFNYLYPPYNPYTGLLSALQEAGRTCSCDFIEGLPTLEISGEEWCR